MYWFQFEHFFKQVMRKEKQKDAECEDHCLEPANVSRKIRCKPPHRRQDEGQQNWVFCLVRPLWKAEDPISAAGGQGFRANKIDAVVVIQPCKVWVGNRKRKDAPRDQNQKNRNSIRSTGCRHKESSGLVGV